MQRMASAWLPADPRAVCARVCLHLRQTPRRTCLWLHLWGGASTRSSVFVRCTRVRVCTLSLRACTHARARSSAAQCSRCSLPHVCMLRVCVLRVGCCISGGRSSSYSLTYWSSTHRLTSSSPRCSTSGCARYGPCPPQTTEVKLMLRPYLHQDEHKQTNKQTDKPG